MSDVIIEQNEITNWGRVALFTADLAGSIAVGDTITGETSGATGVVTEAPIATKAFGVSGHVIYYAADNGLRFDDGESVNASSGGSFSTHEQTEVNGYTHGFGGYGARDYEIATDDMDDTSQRLVIQRNHLYAPRGDANSWYEASAIATGAAVIGPDPPSTTRSHPVGPGGIFLESTLGNHVIRYNTIHGAPAATLADGDKGGHYLMDGIAGRPDGTTGSVHRDRDVSSNDVRYVWDDAIEVESYGINVRVWGNFVDEAFVAFGMAPVATGPLYLVGNLVHRTRKSYGDGYRRGYFVKGSTSHQGHVFVLHNTCWNEGDGGVFQGIANGGSNYWVRNNIIQAEGHAYGGRGNYGGSLNYELYRGTIKSGYAVGPDRIEAAATYAAAGGAFLAQSTLGQGDALVLPNLEWTDRGAEQTGRASIKYGHTVGTSKGAPP